MDSNTHRHLSPKPFHSWPQTLTNMEPTVVCRGLGKEQGQGWDHGWSGYQGVGAVAQTKGVN